MPLPELQTGGVDIRNTVAAIRAMELQDLQRQNLQSEMQVREANSPSLIAERTSQNALRVVQEKETRHKIERGKLDDAAKAVAWVKDHPDPEKAYDEVVARFGQEGVPLPPVDLFKKDGKFDTEKFASYADGGIKARKLMLDPKEGERTSVPMINKGYTTDAPESIDNPKFIKQSFVVKNGKLVADPDVPFEPLVDPIAKEKKSEDKQAATEEHQKAVEKETARHNKELEKSYNNAELRAREMERHNKAVESIMLSKAEYTKRDKTKRIFDADGQKVRELDTAKGPKFQVMDMEGEWIDAPKEVVDKATKVTVAPKKGRFSGAVGVARTTPSKPKTEAPKYTAEQYKAFAEEEIKKRPEAKKAINAALEEKLRAL